MTVFGALITRIQKPQTNRRLLSVATAWTVLAAQLACLLALDLNPTSLTLFLPGHSR